LGATLALETVLEVFEVLFANQRDEVAWIEALAMPAV
jgi:hypothetical protein